MDDCDRFRVLFSLALAWLCSLFSPDCTLTSLSLFLDRFRLFKRDKKAKEARQKKIQAFWKKQAEKQREDNLAKPEPEAVNLKKLEAPEQAPAPSSVPHPDAEPPTDAPPAEEDGSQTATAENSPHNSTDDDEDQDDATQESNGQPGHVMSEESKPVSVIEPPRKLQRSVASDQEQQPGLLCGCI